MTQHGTLERRGSQSLVDGKVATPVSGLITTVDDLAAQLKAASQKYHVISPVISTSSLAPGYGAALSVVNVDPSPASADTYSYEGGLALTKISLMRICAALGISWTDTKRLDNGTRRHYWNVRVSGRYRAPDGTFQDIGDAREVDFTEGSAQIAGKSEKEIAQMRKHGQQLAETKAKLRAIREFGIKPKYTKEELQKPFLVVRLSFMPDMQNPEVAKLVTAAALGVTHLLYGSQQPPADENGGDVPPELGGGQPAPAARQVGAGKAEGPREATFDDDEPEADTRPRHRIDHVLDKNAAGDWTIVLAGGAQHATAVKEIAKAASVAGKAGKAVVLEAASDNGLSRIVELQALDEPAPAAAAAGNSSDDGLRTVADVQEKAGETNGRKWVKFTIVAEGGELWVTFSKTMADDAKHAKANGWKVRIEERQNEKYPDQMDLVSLTAIDPRQGDLLKQGSGKY